MLGRVTVNPWPGWDRIPASASGWETILRVCSVSQQRVFLEHLLFISSDPPHNSMIHISLQSLHVQERKLCVAQVASALVRLTPSSPVPGPSSAIRNRSLPACVLLCCVPGSGDRGSFF